MMNDYGNMNIETGNHFMFDPGANRLKGPIPPQPIGKGKGPIPPQPIGGGGGIGPIPPQPFGGGGPNFNPLIQPITNFFRNLFKGGVPAPVPSSNNVAAPAAQSSTAFQIYAKPWGGNPQINASANSILTYWSNE